MTNVIEVHPAGAQQADLWRLAEDVAATLDGLPWILIGGLMVQLLEAEWGVASGFTSADVDVVLDVRAVTDATERAASSLLEAGDGAFDLPISTLAGAIVIKARVVENTAGRTSLLKHERDLARPLALVEDPDIERSGLTRKERGYLRARGDMADASHRAWRGVRNLLDGVAALRILGDSRHDVETAR